MTAAVQPLPATLPRRAMDAADALLIAGAGGVLGAALLAQALGSGRFANVQALTARPLAGTLPGFEPLPIERLQTQARAHTAAIVFECERRNNGRDEAYVQPQPGALFEWAQRLFDAGVRRLLVVVPHAPALLPQALKAGLASLDEGRVAALGFEQLVFLRAARSGSATTATQTPGWPGRLAGWWLSQLIWMVPQQQLPVRAERVAALAVELAWRLRSVASATRVLPSEVLWLAAQADDGGAVLDDWLHGRPLPAPRATSRRW
ncbi:MAG: hypothetical protein ABIR94_03040 [Rubrivivax sp.]